MAFIHVAHLRFTSQRQQGFDTADAQQQFLMEPHGFVAAVKPPRDRTQFRGILGDFRIQQHKRHIADTQDPDSGIKLTVDQGNRNDDLFALFILGPIGLNYVFE